MTRAGWLAVPAVVWVAVLFVLPLAILLAESLRGPAGWSGIGYAQFFGSAYAWSVVGRTLRVAALVTVLCLLLGYPAAFAMATARGWVQSALMAAVLLPMSLSVIVKAFGWTVLLRGTGLVSGGLQALGLADGPVRLLFTETGLLIGTVNIFLPFMLLSIYASVRQLDGRLLDAAATLGGGPVYRFVRVVLPLTMPGVVAGCTLVFSLSVAAYVIPTLLMGDTFQTLPTMVATAFLFLQDPRRGAVAACVLLALSLLIVGLGAAAGRRAGGES